MLLQEPTLWIEPFQLRQELFLAPLYVGSRAAAVPCLPLY